MTGVDKVLAAIDAGLQHNETEFEYEVVDRSACWRCHGPAGDGASGVCDGCRVVLLDEGHTAPVPTDQVTFRVVFDTTELAAGVVMVGAAFQELGVALRAMRNRILEAHQESLERSQLYREWWAAHAGAIEAILDGDHVGDGYTMELFTTTAPAEPVEVELVRSEGPDEPA